MVVICKIDSCYAVARTRGWCNKHYLRWRINGDPLVTKQAAPHEKLKWLETAATMQTDDCIDWPFLKSCSRGYGTLHYQGKPKLAHHVILMLVGREPPVPPLDTRHLCGRSLCVNPRHLAVSSHRDNMLDMFAHGTAPCGEKSGKAKLKTADILAIRASKESLSKLSQVYGISGAQISRIKLRQRWAHVA